MRTYRVAEFARLAGVTVRTLHHYDRIDLLKPSSTTQSGHRLYLQSDLLRLQQVLTLKWMGFALTDIKALLESPGFELRQSLRVQQSAIDTQIAQLNEASAAVERALAVLDDDSTLDADTLTAIIRGVSSPDQSDWMRYYYSDEAISGMMTRWLAYGHEQMAQVQGQWADIYAAFERLRHLPPASDAVQAVAADMHRLIELFTGGDPDARAGLQQFTEEAAIGELPPGYDAPDPFAGVDDDLRRFMQTAYSIYEENLT